MPTRRYRRAGCPRACPRRHIGPPQRRVDHAGEVGVHLLTVRPAHSAEPDTCGYLSLRDRYACALGEPVRAAASGKVIRIQHKGPGGLEVLVQHDKFVGVYGHLGTVSLAIAEGKTALAAGE